MRFVRADVHAVAGSAAAGRLRLMPAQGSVERVGLLADPSPLNPNIGTLHGEAKRLIRTVPLEART